MGSIPTRRIELPKGIRIGTSDEESPTTGIPASEGERQAANRLAAELERRGLKTEVEPIAVRPSEAGSVVIHAALSVGGGLLGLTAPLLGATICLAVAFSFYSERALGLNLLGRLIPKRSSQNVLSPPVGPVWSGGIGIVLTAGYDIPDAYPVGEWLSRRFSGRLTSDRIVLWAGMIPLFAATMLRLAEIDGLATGLLQMLGSVVLLSMIVAQIDRRMAGRPIAEEGDPAAPGILFEVLDELLDSDEAEQGIGVCFFGAESATGAGGSQFFRRAPLEMSANNALVINFIVGDESAERIQITAREGDLATLRMNSELAADCRLDPEPAILRTTTGAVAARRRGIRAVTIVGRDDEAVDTGLDLADAGLESASFRPDASAHQGDDGDGGDSDANPDQGDNRVGSGTKPAEAARSGSGPDARKADAAPRKRNVTRG